MKAYRAYARGWQWRIQGGFVVARKPPPPAFTSHLNFRLLETPPETNSGYATGWGCETTVNFFCQNQCIRSILLHTSSMCSVCLYPSSRRIARIMHLCLSVWMSNSKTIAPIDLIIIPVARPSCKTIWIRIWTQEYISGIFTIAR